jgi:hypothetical protein
LQSVATDHQFTGCGTAANDARRDTTEQSDSLPQASQPELPSLPVHLIRFHRHVVVVLRTLQRDFGMYQHFALLSRGRSECYVSRFRGRSNDNLGSRAIFTI